MKKYIHNNEQYIPILFLREVFIYIYKKKNKPTATTNEFYNKLYFYTRVVAKLTNPV